MESNLNPLLTGLRSMTGHIAYELRDFNWRIFLGLCLQHWNRCEETAETKETQKNKETEKTTRAKRSFVLFLFSWWCIIMKFSIGVFMLGTLKISTSLVIFWHLLSYSYSQLPCLFIHRWPCIKYLNTMVNDTGQPLLASSLIWTNGLPTGWQINRTMTENYGLE